MTDLHTTHLHNDYLDGLLSDEQKATVDNHIAGCENCRSDLEELKRLTEILGEIESPDPSREYFHNLSDRIESRTSASERSDSSDSSVANQRGSHHILKVLIRLAAVITLLFTSFYISYIKQEKDNTRWAEKISESDYVDINTMALPGMLIEPKAEVNQPEEPVLNEESQTNESETRK